MGLFLCFERGRVKQKHNLMLKLPFFPQLEILKSTIQDMEKERDFYFGKLRNIELICQEKEGEGDPTLQRIIDILYATDVSLGSVCMRDFPF